MLRNTRIRTRLALMAAGPAAVALILTAITFSLAPRVSIGGSAYDQLIYGKEFRVASVAPSLYIVELHTKVQELVLEGTAGRPIAVLQSDISRAQADYERDYTSWVSRLTDAETRTDLVASHDRAEEYFNLYSRQLLPAVRAGRDTQARQLLKEPMGRALASHRAATQAAAKRVQGQVNTQEQQVKAQIRKQEIGIIAITLLIVAASTALGLTILKSITERVQRLNDIATIELPQVLDEVARAALAGEEIPSMPAPRGEGNDELAAVAIAFNSVVATAVGLAGEQSRVRRVTSQMFINLGRRNHKLLSRTLTYITQLESDERDPSTLQNLFRLDHLTTRMRRHAESLLVLAGSPPLRTWSRPVPVADVLRAALSEIETYDRVDVKELEPIEVRGASVSDLAHLLAELLENATAFSPPQTRVRVLGRVDSDGYTVVVVDEGIGMNPAELESANQLINTPDESGFLGDSRMLGLGVVGRLASRHGFRVNLTASPVGGVVAWVTLPTSALAPRRGGSDEPGQGITTALLDATTIPDAPTVDATDAAFAATTAAAVAADIAEPALDGQDVAPLAMNGRPAPDALAPGILPLRRPGTTRPMPTEPGRPAPQVPAEQPAREVAPAAPAAEAAVQPPRYPTADASASSGATGSFSLPPRAPEVAEPPPTGAVIIPPAPGISPVSGPIAFRKPAPGPGEPTSLTRRVRGAQLPDTGEAATPTGEAAQRPTRSAQSVRGALQSFNAGRRTASEMARSATQPVVGLPTGTATTGTTPAVPATSTSSTPDPGQIATTAPDPAGRTAAADPAAGGPRPVAVAGGQALPRRVRGAQMPETDLPASAPPQGRSAAEVRAALSNFVAGRRAAEDED